MAYRSRLQRIQEKRNFSRAMLMLGLGILILALAGFYGVKGMAALAIFIDRLKFGNSKIDASDQIPPTPPTLWSDYTATNSAQISVFGIGEPESTVQLFKNGENIQEVKADSDGKIFFENVFLVPGGNDFWAVARDEAGNSSQQSKNLNILFSDKGPEITIEKPVSDQKFSGKDNPIEVSGKTISGARVFVNGRLTIADGSGVFRMKYTLNEGENVMSIRAIDTAGNETVKEVKLNYQP